MENYNTQGFSFDLPKGNSAIIKVIGVGGGGNNALKHMYEKGIHGVDFVICNTDAQTLDNNPVANKVQLGISITEGLGAGADPEVGEKAAIESIDEIKAALGQNTKMVFITAGMGGGTGTGAAPVIAKVAKEMGILTVGIVTVPFSFEGKRRLDQADSGLDKLRNNVDSLIVINNDKLRQQFGNLGFKQGFSKADEVLTNAAKGMAEVITGYFDVNIDFRDAKSVLQNSGTALMSTGAASGENKAEAAVKKALDSPLLNDNKITGAKNVLLLIRSGAEEVTMDEIGVIMDHIQQEAGHTADIIFGVGTDEELADQVSVLVIATGFSKDDRKNTGPAEKIRFTLDDVPQKKESPFKSSIEKESPFDKKEESKSLFRLDDEETPKQEFKPAAPQQTKSETQELEFKVIDKSETPQNSAFDAVAENKPTTMDLFSFDDNTDEELEAESFNFETSTPNESFQNNENTSEETENKPIEFSFFVNEPITEPEVTFGHTSEETVSQPVQNFTSEAETKIQNTVAEAKVEETPVVEVEESKSITEEFTFYSKSVPNDRAAERRNKLKEFNSRYTVTDTENAFENVPAFKRKNIALEGFNASEQHIKSFLTENKSGEMEVRENRFLNKDVD